MKIYEIDLQNMLKNFSDYSMLRNSTILITGATGLIGSQLINFFLFLNFKKNTNIRIYGLVRDLEKAKKLFTSFLEEKNLFFLECDVVQNFNIQCSPDFIIHGASYTASHDFITFPVETIMTAIIGTSNLVNFAKQKKIQSFVYLSSMEVFGQISDEKEKKENEYGYIDILSARSSYSESKRMCECLCSSYFIEYSVPIKIARLAQTFGPGLNYTDTRVPAQFARAIIENTDIVLKTEGKTIRPSIYISDAITAILYILLKGESGEAYNVANKSTAISIRDTAEMLVNKIAKNRIKIIYENSIPEEYKPNINLKLNMNTDKLEQLGWKAEIGMQLAYERMIQDFIESK